MKTLEGKVAVITGGSSGIGLATAKRFVDEGAHVVITGRREKELKEAATFLKRSVTTVVGDVSRLEDLDRLYAVVKENTVTSTFSSPTRAPAQSHRSR